MCVGTVHTVHQYITVHHWTMCTHSTLGYTVYTHIRITCTLAPLLRSISLMFCPPLPTHAHRAQMISDRA